jgi:hypothetical protein
MGNLLVISDNRYKKMDGFSSSLLTDFANITASAYGLTWDGANLLTHEWSYVSNGSSTTHTFRKHSGFTSGVDASFTLSYGLGTNPAMGGGITWDGTNLIIAARTVIKRQAGFSSSPHGTLAEIASPAGNCFGVSWDPATGNLLSVDYTARKLYVHQGFSTTILDTIDLGSLIPRGVEHVTDADFTYLGTDNSEAVKKLTGISASVADSLTFALPADVSSDDRYSPVPPSSPTLVSPISDFVSTDTTPTLTWTHFDANGDAQAAATVEIQTADGGTVTPYPVVQSGTAQTYTAGTALTATPATRYRWRVKTSDGTYGPNSDYGYFWIATAPSVALITPAAGGTVTFPQFTVGWGTVSGGGGTQADYTVSIARGGSTFFTSGLQSGAGTTYVVPGTAGLVNGTAHVITLAIHDQLGQAASTSGTIHTLWDGPAAITSVAIQPVGGS